MIISASRRTDIPAFYSDWFFNRIKEGFLLVRNPMNIHQISRINLSPNIVDCIVFWTKNPMKIINRLNELEKYDYYFQFTITGYGQRLEPNVIQLDQALQIFIDLSNKLGSKRLIWRYDPIIISNEYDLLFHFNNFEAIARALAGKTNRCVISFVDIYKNNNRNLSSNKVAIFTNEMMVEIAKTLKYISSKYGIELTTCAEEIDMEKYGISHGSCIDDKLINEVFGIVLTSSKDKNQRKECGCIASIDIGAYNTCPHNCIYCYANYNSSTVKKNYLSHNPLSPLLFGKVEENDKVIERKVFSCKEIQYLSLFDK